MYDHNTQRPRGFGFITYDSEGAVDKALLNTFHDLNGKKVEVKRAVPKELRLVPTHGCRLIDINYSVNRGNSFLSGCTQEGNSFLSGYTQGYNPSSINGYGMKMDAKLGALSSWRNERTSLGPGFRVGIDHNPTLNSSILGNANHNNILKYGQELNLYYSRNSSRSNSPIPYSDINQNTSTLLNFMPPNVLGNTGLNYTVNCVAATASLASGSKNPGSFRNSSLNWGSTFPISSQFGGSRSDFLGGRSFERSVSPVANTNVTTSSSG